MIVYGKQIVFYILQNHPSIIEEIYFAKKIDKKLFNKFTSVGAKINKLDNKKAQSFARGGNHQGFLLKIKDYQFVEIDKLKKKKFLVILDGLTDVGNIGAIIRTCYALGVGGVVICGIKNPSIASIIRTSSGTMLDIPVSLVHNSLDLANELKQVGYSLIGADLDGIDLKNKKEIQNENIALFLGNEGYGLSNRLKKKLDEKLYIRMENGFDSLNVSVAAGILIFSLK